MARVAVVGNLLPIPHLTCVCHTEEAIEPIIERALTLGYPRS